MWVFISIVNVRLRRKLSTSRHHPFLHRRHLESEAKEGLKKVG